MKDRTRRVCRWAIPPVVSVALHAAACVTFIAWTGVWRDRPPRVELPGGSGARTRVLLLPSEAGRAEAPAGVVAADVDAVSEVVAPEVAEAEVVEAAAEVAHAPDAKAGPLDVAALRPVVRERWGDVAQAGAAWAERARQVAGRAASRAAGLINEALTAPASAARPPVVGAAAGVVVEASSADAGEVGEFVEETPGVYGAGSPGVAEAPSPFSRNTPPEYPVECRRRKEQGTVVVHAVVEADGSVSDASVRSSSGVGLLDRAALEAVRGWTFHPGVEAGVPVRAEVDVPIVFVLK
ncbi:MAG: energy transducer TonB [Phycisphaerales bacterium]